MKKILLVSGYMATGKSTFSRIISKSHGIPLFNKDEIKEILGDTIGFSNRAENRKLSTATYEILKYNFKKIIPTGNNLILESNFRQSELDEITSLSEKAGYQYLILYLYGDLDVLFKRYRYRIDYENRHPVHRSPDIKTIEEFTEYINSTKPELKYKNVIQIDASSFDYQNDEALIKEINKFLEE